jgi:PKD repeat protein
MFLMRVFGRNAFHILFFLLSVSLISVNSEAHDNIYVHPYIAEQAFYVWPNDTDHEIYSYLGPGYRDTGYSCDNAKQGNRITEGAKEEDDYDPYADVCVNDPSALLYGYYHHFYNSDISGDYNGLFDAYGALYYARIYWQRALNHYDDNRGLSYWYLGRIAHLLADASVPAHVLRDPHFPGNNDSYEDHVKTNYESWSAQDARNLGDMPEYSSLGQLFSNLAQRAQYFPSDDKDGNTSNTSPSWFEGWPDTAGWRIEAYDRYIALENRQKIGDHMMPLAIQYTADLYRLFWRQVHPGETDFAGSPRSGSEPLTVSFTNLSTYDATSWAWDFGDGSTSSTKNPAHTYETPGYYTVTLSATGADGTVKITKNNYVNVGSCENGHMRISGVIHDYPTLQEACDTLADDDLAQMHAFVFSEDIVFQNNVSVILKGGYNCDYSSNPGFTTISGSLTIKAGTITVDKLIIK